MAEMLLQLDGSTRSGPEEISQAVERAGGRVLHAWPPYAVIVEAEGVVAAELRSLPGVVAAYATEVPGSVVEAAPETFKLAATAWNNHLSRVSTKSSEGLSWDAPNHLPPDAPPHIQKMLRRREEKEL